MGYFCHFEFIPRPIIDHIRTCLKLGKDHSAIATYRSRRRYREAIRQYLKISSYNKQGQKIALQCNALQCSNSSGSEPKIDKPAERYILTAFAYGCNLGPNQMARHAKGKVTSHALSYTNRRHISAQKDRSSNSRYY